MDTTICYNKNNIAVLKNNNIFYRLYKGKIYFEKEIMNNIPHMKNYVVCLHSESKPISTSAKLVIYINLITGKIYKNIMIGRDL